MAEADINEALQKINGELVAAAVATADVDARAKALQERLDKSDQELDGDHRVKARALVDDTDMWKRVVSTLSWILGIGGPVVGLGVLGWAFWLVIHSTEEMKKEVSSIVDEKVLGGEVVNKAVAGMTDRLGWELDVTGNHNVNALLSNSRHMLTEMIRGGSEARSRLKSPSELRELEYEIDAIISTYGPQLAAGTVDAQRRRALLILNNALIDQVRGNTETAPKWLDAAEAADDKLIEAYVFKGYWHRSLCRYKKDKTWSNPEDWAKAVNCFEKAVELNKDGTNLEARKAKPLLLALQRKFDEAIAAADQEIDSEGAVKDARVLHAASVTYILEAQDCPTGAAALRRKAIDKALEAFRADPEYIKALNNYLWWVTHDINDGMTLSCDVTEQEVASIRMALDSLWAQRTTRFYSDIIFTGAEAAAVVANYYQTSNPERYIQYRLRALEEAHRGLEISDFYDAPDDRDYFKKRLELIIKMLPGNAATHPAAATTSKSH